MEQLFVYGSLMDADVQRRIIGRLVPGTPDTLDGYAKKSINTGDGVYPIIYPWPGGAVDGDVLDVTPDELAKIDLYETEDYKRLRVTLRSGATTWVYME